MRVAVRAERRATGRSSRRTRSGSTHAAWTAKAMSHDEDPEREHPALGQRLGAHVGVAQERQPEAVEDDRLPSLRDQPVDDHDEYTEAQPPARRRGQRAPGPRAEPGDHDPESGGGEDDRVRIDERDHGERPEVDAGGQRPGPRDRGTPRDVRDRRPHDPSPRTIGSGTTPWPVAAIAYRCASERESSASAARRTAGPLEPVTAQVGSPA